MEEELVGWRRREISVMPDLLGWALRPRLERTVQAAFQLGETGGESGPRMPRSRRQVPESCRRVSTVPPPTLR